MQEPLGCRQGASREWDPLVWLDASNGCSQGGLVDVVGEPVSGRRGRLLCCLYSAVHLLLDVLLPATTAATESPPPTLLLCGPVSTPTSRPNVAEP